MKVNKSNAPLPFSNMMVFGDSLSDIGNFPESITTLQAASNEVAQNMYIPVSNPVNTSIVECYTVPDYPEQRLPFPNLDLDSPYLSQPVLLDGQPRLYRSSGWTQYFINEAYLDQPAHVIMPWVISLTHQNLTIKHSLNYAWYSALTTGYCSDSVYRQMDVDCDAESIISTQRHYRLRQTDDVPADINQVQIPGLLQQVALFHQDVAKQRVVVDERTAYFIFIGGNDLSNAFNLLATFKVGNIRRAIKDLSGVIANNVRQAADQLLQNKAQQVYILELYHLGMSPRVYRNRYIAAFGGWLTRVFNRQLLRRVKCLQKQYPTAKIQLLPVYQWIDHLSKTPRFKSLYGQQCDDQAQYHQPAADPQNCTLEHGNQAYLFWNNSHPSCWMHQYIAHRVLQAVKQTEEK